jgi:hypothetical protein
LRPVRHTRPGLLRGPAFSGCFRGPDDVIFFCGWHLWMVLDFVKSPWRQEHEN